VVNALPASKSVPALQASHLSLTKVATEANFSAAGVILHYTMVATNDGNVTLTGVSISDAKLGTLTCPQPVTLAPLATLSCSGTYPTTQADVDAGKVDNTANASGSFGATVVNALPASKSVPAIQTQALKITKTATPGTYDHAGQVISYSFKVENTGNVTISAPFTVIDNKATDEACPLTPSSLDPGQFITCTASYTILLSDMNSGSVTNAAHATGKFGVTTVTSNTDTETVTATQSLALKITKTATPGTYDHAGQVIGYSFKVENTSNVTISAPFTVIDDKATDEACPLTPSSLDPGQFITCTASYTILLSEMNSGSVTNAAYATGKDGEITVTSNTDTETVTATQSLALKITKTATPGTYDHAGQVIGYSFKVENTGNVTISAPFTVIDDKTTNETCPLTPSSLDPAESINCTANYTILRGDMTSGSVTNAAYVTGKFGETTVTSNTDTETITATQILTYTFLPLVNLSKPGVQVLPSSFYYVSHDTMFIIGEVLNNTSDSVTVVEVTIDYFDTGGHLVDTGHAYLWPLDLPAWEKGCFNISMNVPPSWSYYQFKTPTYYISATSLGLTIFDDSGLYNPGGNGDYDIIGQVHNDGNQRSTVVGVSGTLYNVSGVPVGCEHANVNSTNLDPGQISSFAINFWGYYRDYKDVTFYKLRVAGNLP
jgi:hypothetical protein